MQEHEEFPPYWWDKDKRDRLLKASEVVNHFSKSVNLWVTCGSESYRRELNKDLGPDWKVVSPSGALYGIRVKLIVVDIPTSTHCDEDEIKHYMNYLRSRLTRDGRLIETWRT